MKLYQMMYLYVACLALAYFVETTKAARGLLSEEDLNVVTDGSAKSALLRLKERRLQRIYIRRRCKAMADEQHASQMSKCANDIFFAGHKNPTANTNTASTVCSTVTSELVCGESFGCAWRNGVCFDVTANSRHCDYPSQTNCEAEPTNACYWKPAQGGDPAQCLLKFQDCSQLGPVQCTNTNGCMWFNDLIKGHQRPTPTIQSQARGRCMADPCFRINNGRCTVQHTGGRCVWWNRRDNRVYRGFNFPGCYASPCNNRYNKRSCLAQNAIGGPFKCIWCGSVRPTAGGPKLKMGCQNKEATTTAQCWNIQAADRGTPVPEMANRNCRDCVRGSRLTTSGTCNYGRNTARADRCAKVCCQSPACTCFYGTSTAVRPQSSSGLNIYTGNGLGGSV